MMKMTSNNERFKSYRCFCKTPCRPQVRLQCDCAEQIYADLKIQFGVYSSTSVDYVQL